MASTRIPEGDNRWDPPPRPASIRRQEPGTTQPRPPTVAEVRVAQAARDRAQAALSGTRCTNSPSNVGVPCAGCYPPRNCTWAAVMLSSPVCRRPCKSSRCGTGRRLRDSLTDADFGFRWRRRGHGSV